jgi:hypothetical protein
MIASADHIIDLLSHFTQLRQKGNTSQQAWQGVLTEAGDISPKQLGRLQGFCQAWEEREGHKYPQLVQKSPSPDATLLKPPTNRPAPTTMLDAKALAALEGKLVAPAQKPNVVRETAPLPEKMLPDDSKQSYFGQTSKAQLYFRDFPDTVLTLEIPQDGELVIGRLVSGSALVPDVDLSPVHANHYGISRFHVALQRNRKNNTLTITDLGSANQTHVNRDLLTPYKPYILKHNDQIWIADLLTQIQYRH